MIKSREANIFLISQNFIRILLTRFTSRYSALDIFATTADFRQCHLAKINVSNNVVLTPTVRQDILHLNIIADL